MVYETVRRWIGKEPPRMKLCWVLLRIMFPLIVPRFSHPKIVTTGDALQTFGYRAVFTWLSKRIGFGFGFGFTTPFSWLVYLLWFWFYDSQVKTVLLYFRTVENSFWHSESTNTALFKGRFQRLFYKQGIRDCAIIISRGEPDGAGGGAISKKNIYPR